MKRNFLRNCALTLVIAPSICAAIGGPADPDPTFGNNADGRQTLAFNLAPSGFDKAFAIAQNADGDIYQVGSVEIETGRFGVGIARFDAHGILDPNFTGVVYDFPAPITRTDPADAVVQADGKLVVVGSLFVGEESGWFICRTLPDGTPDPAFGVFEGQEKPGCFAFVAGQAHAVLLQQDGKIIVAGSGNDKGTYFATFLRLDQNGIPDDTFGTSHGLTLIPELMATTVLDVATGPNEEIYAAGYQAASESENNVVVAALSEDGIPIATFGNIGIDGVSVVPVGPAGASLDRGQAIVALSDGDVLVAGSAQPELGGPVQAALVRLAPTGVLSENFQDPQLGAGRKIYDPCAGQDLCSSSATGVLEQEDGAIVLAGSVATSDDNYTSDYFAARVLPDGTPDASFNSDFQLPGFSRIAFDGGQIRSEDVVTGLIQHRGKPLLGGYVRREGDAQNWDFALARLGDDSLFKDGFEEQ